MSVWIVQVRVASVDLEDNTKAVHCSSQQVAVSSDRELNVKKERENGERGLGTEVERKGKTYGV